MVFALILLALLVAACLAGSVISQGQAESYYITNYSSAVSSVILTLKLDDVFHCAWFIVLTAALCLNLLCCNLLRFPAIIKRMKACVPETINTSALPADCELNGDASTLFRELGFSKTQEYSAADGSDGIYAVRNRIGLWGAWLTHLGILIIIVGFALGQMTAEKYTVYGVPGQTKSIEGTKYELRIDDFSAELREDDTVKQYISQLTLIDTETGECKSGETSVNHPLNINGMKIYQNSTGWAADVRVYKNDELIQTEVVCAGEYTTVEAIEELYVVFRAFYPDYITDASGQPASASGRLNNPAYLYILYYGDRVLGMNVLQANEKITIQDYSIIFANPRSYSLLQLKTDKFTGVALVGGVVILIALFIAFYFPTEELRAVKCGDSRYKLYGSSPKGGILFKEKLNNKSAELSSDRSLRKAENL